MEISPDKRHKAPRSAPQNDQQQIAARQQRFVQQMLNKTSETIFSNGSPLCVVPDDPCALVKPLLSLYFYAGERKPEGSLNVTSAAHKLSLAAGRPDLIHLRPGKYTFNSSIMPTTPQVNPRACATARFQSVTDFVRLSMQGLVRLCIATMRQTLSTMH